MSSSSKKSPRSSTDEDNSHGLRRGPWTLEEDTILTKYISCHGERHWNLLAKRSGLRRTGKSCRLRWLNYLKPDVKRGNLTPQEQLLILELHSKWGNRWSKIAQHLPGRADNEIKNYWRTRVQKQARHLKIDSNSAAFQEMIRCIWMPRLLQKMQLSSSSSSILSQNSAINPPPIIEQLSSSLPEVSLNGHGLRCSDTSSEQSTSPSITSSGSMNFPHNPQMFSEYPSNPFLDMGNNDLDAFLKGCDNVDNCLSNDTGNIMAYMEPPEEFEEPIRGCQVDENNWTNGINLADSLWNMDEAWKFRQLQERDA
ncbi:hypothetical protein RHSIM_Rhsim08G0132300 [Rhododendron simsii]|uniref:Uncharacterized protein n=1 Tax=Rhododendron simsii TaxID=118357 RepID=A0A834LE98_RHOSS|nr:hypothetical protein RHSIM_Rhsim08G0132300 [Rhododendron simsii]